MSAIITLYKLVMFSVLAAGILVVLGIIAVGLMKDLKDERGR